MLGKIAVEEHFAVEDTLAESSRVLPATYWKELSGRLLDIHDNRLQLMDAHGIEMIGPQRAQKSEVTLTQLRFARTGEALGETVQDAEINYAFLTGTSVALQSADFVQFDDAEARACRR